MPLPHKGLAHIQCAHCYRHDFPWFRRNETCNRLCAMSLALPQDSVSILRSFGVLYLMIVTLPSQVLRLMKLLIHPALLITCARLPVSALQGDAISVNNDPIPVKSKARKSRILVSYGGSVLWLLHVDDCQTWFVSILDYESDFCSRLDEL